MIDETRGRGRPNTGAGAERVTLRLPAELRRKLKSRYGQYAPVATAIRLALTELFEGKGEGKEG